MGCAISHVTEIGMDQGKKKQSKGVLQVGISEKRETKGKSYVVIVKRPGREKVVAQERE